MSERQAKGCLLAALIWCIIILVLGVAYRFLVHPYLAEKLKWDTGSASQYKNEIVVAADSFSGYAILRSEAVREQLRAQQVKLTIRDDKADYAARLEALRNREVQMAVFTIDSLISAGSKAGDFPASIILVIDETIGGDAIVANEDAMSSLNDLNDPEARIVLTPDSPSEFLARVVIAHFNLPRLAGKWRIEADGADAVLKKLRSSGTREKRAYVLWEPYVSKALEDKKVHVLLDSSKLKGYIVDVLVAERQFLHDQPELVQAVVEAYCRAAYTYGREKDGMLRLIMEDARNNGAERLNEEQARRVVEGIHWKNTLENYAHFGVTPGATQGGVQHLEDIIGNITDVLVKTGAIPRDPLPGQHATLFFNRTLAAMHEANFHPGKGLNLLDDVGPAPEEVIVERELPALSDEQWKRLRPVGELKAEPVEFTRGSANLTIGSKRDLNELARRLESFPQFYVRVVGHARAEGDPEANRLLARQRADAAADALTSHGLSRNRIRAEAASPSTDGAEAQAVSFDVGQIPY